MLKSGRQTLPPQPTAKNTDTRDGEPRQIQTGALDGDFETGFSQFGYGAQQEEHFVR